MQKMSAVGIPPSSLQGCIDSVFWNKHLILEVYILPIKHLLYRTQVYLVFRYHHISLAGEARRMSLNSHRCLALSEYAW